MKKVIVKTQAELDAISVDDNVIIEIRDAADLIKIIKRYKNFVQVYNSTVRAYDNSAVDAYDNSTVYAYDNSTVYAYGNSTVCAYGNSTVRANGNSAVGAYDNSTVYANGNSAVYAYCNSTVYAINVDVKVGCRDGAKVIALTQYKDGSKC